MQLMRRSPLVFPRLLFLAALPALASIPAVAQKFSVLYSFTGPAYPGEGPADAAFPEGSLVAGPDGVFYGTAQGGYIGYGYPVGEGAIFRLTPPKEPTGKWTEDVIWRFNASKLEGGFPVGTLVLDPEGNLYGVTSFGNGGSDCGAVFELSPPTKARGAWTETTLHVFEPIYPKPETDACQPEAGLLRGPEGALYGTTRTGTVPAPGVTVGGADTDGDIFRLTPPAEKGGKWKYELLYQFNGNGIGLSGDSPSATLIFGPGGLYGTTLDGGDAGNGDAACGIVFKLTAPTKAGEPWTKTDLYTAKCESTDPYAFEGGVIFDKLGNLYGTSLFGGSNANCDGNVGCGSIFELSPGTHGWTEKTLYAFQDKRDGAEPNLENLLMDAMGNLYGVTDFGGEASVDCQTGSDVTGCGVVFKLTPPAIKGKPWTETVLYRFTFGSDGGKPQGTLIFDKDGNLYGTATVSEDDTGFGTVFRITP